MQRADSRSESLLVQSLISGLSFALPALIFSFLFFSNAEGRDWGMMIGPSTFAAFFWGTVLWALLAFNPRRVTTLFGAIVGLLVGLLSHPLAWYLAILYYYFTGATDSLGGKTLRPGEGFIASFTFSMISLLLVGWITGPVGAMVGALMGYLQSRKVVLK